jgi:hypothetical protein
MDDLTEAWRLRPAAKVARKRSGSNIWATRETFPSTRLPLHRTETRSGGVCRLGWLRQRAARRTTRSQRTRALERRSQLLLVA